MTKDRYDGLRKLRDELRHEFAELGEPNNDQLWDQLDEIERDVQDLLKDINEHIDIIRRMQAEQNSIKERLDENAGHPSVSIDSEESASWLEATKGALNIVAGVAHLDEMAAAPLPAADLVEKREASAASMLTGLNGSMRTGVVRNLRCLIGVLTSTDADEVMEVMGDSTINTIMSDDVCASSPF